jgi:hypothetical protein
MKTQLLEDIGENTASSLAPSKLAGHSNAASEVHTLAPAAKAQPARPRSALGVWRQAPAVEPQVSTTQQPDQQAAPLDLNNVFEEIAALEAQYVAPVQQHDPPMAPAAPQHELPATPAEPLHEPAVPPAWSTRVPDPTDTPTTPHDPLFDFTLPSPELQEANPFTRPAAGATRSRRRFLLWGTALLAGVLLVLGGRWLYQENKDAGALALIANDVKEQPRVDKAVQPQAVAAKESTQEPEREARVKSTAPAEPASGPASSGPPLVYLEPDPPPAAKAEQPASVAASPAEPRTAPEPAPAGEQARVYPIPKRARQQARERPEAPARRAKARAEPAPPRQLARASVVAAEKRSGPDTSMEASLKACREHGYHAAQCIKRDCRVTEYGFVCRGR